MCGGSSPLAAVVDPIENLGGQIGDAGASIDSAVNNNVPGGWATVGALALGGALATGALGGLGEATVAEGTAGATSGAAGGATAGAIGSDVAAQAALDDLIAQQSALYSGATAGAAGGAAAGGVGSAGTVGSDALTSGAALGGNTLGSGYVAGTGTGLTGAGLGATGGEVGTGILTGGGTGAGLGTGLVGSGTGLGLTSAEALTGGLGLNGVTAAGLASAVPTYASGLTASDIANGLRAANVAKNILAPTTTNLKPVSTGSNAPAAINAALSTMPATYKQGNPFTFTQQQPIQDNNQLATLLRNIYGNQPV
jgi:hypothetical protein